MTNNTELDYLKSIGFSKLAIEKILDPMIYGYKYQIRKIAQYFLAHLIVILIKEY